MKIEIWSDIACPFCYIGKKKLENALAQFPQSNNIELIWKSYELNPNLPKQALKDNYYIYLASKLGKTELEMRTISQQVIAQAKEVGLNFDFENLINANTNDALRFVKLAAQYGKADSAEELLFKAYFIDSQDVSSKQILFNIGEQLNIPQQKVIDMLESDLFLKDVQNDMTQANEEFNLQYIPYYLVNNKHIIQGAIESNTYLEIITKAYSEWENTGESINSDKDIIGGQVCSLDGICS